MTRRIFALPPSGQQGTPVGSWAMHRVIKQGLHRPRIRGGDEYVQRRGGVCLAGLSHISTLPEPTT